MKTSSKLFSALIAVSLLLSGFSAYSQQDAQFSMYMFNGMALNPAYAGSRDALAVTALYRHQWAGFEGAPKTATLTAHGVLAKDRLGLGGALTSDNLGVTHIITATLNYAYRIPIKKTKLSLGVSTAINNYRNRWTEVTTNDGGDNAFSSNSPSVISPNFGVGAYWYGDLFYVGASIPHLLNASLGDNFKYQGTDVVARQFRHYFFTGGFVVNLLKSGDLKLKPSFLFKYVDNTPFQADINLAFLIKEALWVGASYRTGDAVVGMLEYTFAKGFRLGYAYDFTLTELTNYNSGSHEIMLGYEFRRTSRYLTPRRMSYF